MKKLKKTKIFIFGKNLTMPKKTERGTLWDFSTSILSQNIKKMQGDPLGKIFFEKKSRSAEKNERGESLVSPGMVCYAEKQEKPFWFSSLDRIVHFDAIIFCRTFVELFRSVRVDRKKRVTIIVAFHFMKRRLKMKGNPLQTIKIFRKKSLTMPKKLKGGPFSLAWYCMLSWKRRRNFLYLSSSCQKIQFGT